MPAVTLGAFDAAAYDLIGHCTARGCGHARALDVAALRGRLGPTFEVPAIGALLRCERCAAKGGRVTVSPRRTDGS